MFNRSTQACSLLLLGVVVAGAGCTAMREVPRGDYAARPERQHVRIETTEGLHYEFDYVRVEHDTLTGFKERDVEGPLAEISTVRIPLDDVRVLSTRQIDWYKTGLAGGIAVAAVIAAVITTSGGDIKQGGTSGGGKGGLPGGGN